VKVTPITTTRTALEDLDNTLMLFYTGKTRQARPYFPSRNPHWTERRGAAADDGQAHQVRRLVEVGDIDGLGAILHQAGGEAKARAGCQQR